MRSECFLRRSSGAAVAVAVVSVRDSLLITAISAVHDQYRLKGCTAAAAAAPPSQLRHITVTGRNNGWRGVGGGCETGAGADDAWPMPPSERAVARALVASRFWLTRRLYFSPLCLQALSWVRSKECRSMLVCCQVAGSLRLVFMHGQDTDFDSYPDWN